MSITYFLISCWLMLGAVLIGFIILDENKPGQSIGRKLIACGIIFALIPIMPFLFIYNKITHKLW